MTTTRSPESLTLGARIADQARAAAGLESSPAWVVFIRLFIGLGWLRVAIEKIFEPGWWDGTEMTAFIDGYSLWTLGWYRPFVDNVIAPNTEFWAIVVVAAQLLVAASLLSGRFLGYGLGLGIFMNLNFLAAGSVDPSVFYLLSQGAIVFWLAERRKASKWVLRSLSTVALTVYALAMMSLPSITTLHPARVIIDAAIMFVVLALITVIACDRAHRSISGGRGLPAIDWLLRRDSTGITVDTDEEVLVIR